MRSPRNFRLPIPTSLVALILLLVLPLCLAQRCRTIAPSFAPIWGRGFSGSVIMNGLTEPRGIIFDHLGNALVVERGAGVRYIKFRDNGATDLCVASSKPLIRDSELNHGISLDPQTQTLFVSAPTTVYAYAYNATTGTATNRTAVVTNMGIGTHTSRTLLVSRAQPDALIVAVGSDGNVDPATMQERSGRSQLRTFRIPRIMQRSARYLDGEVLGWGLRNSVGVTEDPLRGGIWSVENGVDNMVRRGVDIHNTNPCEELNYHGTLSRPSMYTGANYGYPACYAAWDPSVIPNDTASAIQVGTQFAIGTLNNAMCAEKVPPRMCFAPHTAPLGIKFNRDSTAAYIAFHGSWNRSPPDGYRVSLVRFNPSTGMPLEPPTSKTAAIDVLSNVNNTNCPRGCFRPVDLAFDLRRRLFMTSDTTGELWVIWGTG